MKKIEVRAKDIPRIKDLTVKQFKSVIDKCIDDGTLNYLKYLALFTGIEYEQLKKAKSGKYDLVFLVNHVGDFDEDYKNNKVPKYFELKNKIHEVKGLGLDTIGKEYTFTSMINDEMSELEVYCLLLAIQFNERDDTELVEDNLRDIENKNWVDIMTIGNFFLHRSKIFQKKGIRHMIQLLNSILTKIKHLKSKSRLIA